MSSSRKTCCKCKDSLPVDQFTKCSRNKDGLDRACRSCKREYWKEWYGNQTPELMKQRNARYRAENPRKALEYRLNRYNITLAEYDAMVKIQGEKCFICGTTDNLCIDHCHSTGKFRGLLCRPHNAILGIINDDINQARRIVEYLS